RGAACPLPAAERPFVPVAAARGPDLSGGGQPLVRRAGRVSLEPGARLSRDGGAGGGAGLDGGGRRRVVDRLAARSRDRGGALDLSRRPPAGARSGAGFGG